MSKIKPTDFRYYFAVDRGDYKRFQEDFAGQSVLVSFVYLTEKKDKRGDFREMLAKHDGTLMIDSGGFTNFTTPGTVTFEEWSEFMTDASGWADEYVQFDDLSSRPNSMRLYEKALGMGLNPLFVDHLWFPTHDEEVKRIWKSDEKLCMSGFAKTLPGQRRFPGDPNKKLAQRFDQGRELETFNHLLAVGSLRKFMGNLDRVHSVDSAAWDKAAAFGKVLIYKEDMWGDVKVPILRAYDRPDARVRRRPMTPEVKRDDWDRVVAQHKWNTTTANLSKHVSIYHTKKYIEAIRAFDPAKLREQEERKKAEGGKVKKTYFDFDLHERVEIPGDNRVPAFNSTVGEDIDKMIESSLARVVSRPRIEHVISATPDELFANNIEKAKKPWLTYYFACSPGQLKKHFADGENDVLISFANFVKGKKRLQHKNVPWDELKGLKKRGRRVMLDSGAFTNFNKPDAVRFEEYLEFLKTPETKEVFDEYVMFDELRCRKTTLNNYVKMLEEGHDPLFVDHLWHDDDEAATAIWKSRQKLCLSGFAMTLPTQERFPGDPKARLADAMLRGREVETQTHLLAVSSLKRFLKYADRVDSVDSTAWVKASVYSMYLHMEWVEKNGVMVPVQKVYDSPHSGRKQTRFAPPKEARKANRRVREIRKERGFSRNQAWVQYSIEQARLYAASLNALNPKDIVEAYDTDVKKGIDPIVADRGRGFAFISDAWGQRDEVVKAEGSPSTSLDPEQVGILDPRSYRPQERSDEQLRQDWDVVTKVWSAFKQYGEEEVGYKRDEIIGLAVTIVKEAVRRGPETIVFNVGEMKPDTSELWGAVVRLAKPPADMVSKEVITPDTIFDGMHPDQLLSAHEELHKVATRVAASRQSADWSWAELVDTHGRLVEALTAQGYAHPQAKGLLDTSSEPFEKNQQVEQGHSRLSLIESGLADAEATLAQVEEGTVKKAKAPSGASRPLEAVAIEKMLLAVGPPAQWTEVEKAALGPAWRRRINTFWNKSNAATRRFIADQHASAIDIEKATINSSSGAKKHPARYVSHLHYRGNQVDMLIRMERKAGSGSLETWRLPIPPMSVSVTSLSKAQQMFTDGEAPLPGIGEVRRFEKVHDTPRGWLTSQGTTPPGAYGSSGSAPGVFHMIESGEYTRSVNDDVMVLKLTPDSGEETRLLVMKRVPVSEVHFGDGAVQTILHDQFDAPHVGSLIAKLSLEDGGAGTWCGRFGLLQETAKGKYDHINFKPPAGVREELRRGLKWHEEGHSGDGLVSDTVTWATRMAGGDDISPEKARKMRAWLARHESDKTGKGFEPGEEGFPSPGRVAWALWGGDAAVGWSSKLVEQMEAADRKNKKTLDKHDHGAIPIDHDQAVPSAITQILKAEKRLVTGVVLQPEVVDAQDDIISQDEIEQAAHNFLARYNRETEMGLMHKVFGDVGVDLVESYVTPAPLTLGGRKLRKGTWIMTVKVHDDELWGMVKEGKLTGFSIGGVANSIKG